MLNKFDLRQVSKLEEQTASRTDFPIDDVPNLEEHEQTACTRRILAVSESAQEILARAYSCRLAAAQPGHRAGAGFCACSIYLRALLGTGPRARMLKTPDPAVFRTVVGIPDRHC